MQIHSLRPSNQPVIPLHRITLQSHNGLGACYSFSSFAEANSFFPHYAAAETEQFRYRVEWEGHVLEDMQSFPEESSDGFLEKTIEDLMLDRLLLPTGSNLTPEDIDRYLTSDIYLDFLFLSEQDTKDYPLLLSFAEGLHPKRYQHLLDVFEAGLERLEKSNPILIPLGQEANTFLSVMTHIPRSTYFKDSVLRTGKKYLLRALIQAGHGKEDLEDIEKLHAFQESIFEELPILDERITKYGQTLYNLFPKDTECAVPCILDDADITGFFNRLQEARTALPLSRDLPDRELFYAVYRHELNEEFSKPLAERSHFHISVQTAKRLAKMFPKRRIATFLMRYDPFTIASSSYYTRVLDQAFA